MRPRMPAGLTLEEEELFLRLRSDMDPRTRIDLISIKTAPLTDAAKTAFEKLGADAGFTVTFPELPHPNPDSGRPPSHSILAVRSTPR